MNTIGIITAVKWESQPIVEAYGLEQTTRGHRAYFTGEVSGTKIVLTNCHAGPVNASAATEALINQFSPQWIISLGSAGSHSLDILPGQAVVGKDYTMNYNVVEEERGTIRRKKSSLIRFFGEDGEEVVLDSIPADATLLAALRELAQRDGTKLSFATIGSEDAWTIDKRVIEAKVRRFGHQVEDKESAYIAQICYQHGVPFVSVRGVSDNELVGGAYTVAEMDGLMAKASVGAAQVVKRLVEKLASGLL